MKKIGSYLVLQFSFFLSFGQTDSLKLNLTYEPVYADSEIRSNLRLDFISFKKEPISFYNRAHYLLECGFDDIGINIEVLENNCFRSFEFSECMLLPDIKRSNENVKVLKYRDTVTYTHYCSYLE